MCKDRVLGVLCLKYSYRMEEKEFIDVYEIDFSSKENLEYQGYKEVIKGSLKNSVGTLK